jgi:hypothetical protein
VRLLQAVRDKVPLLQPDLRPEAWLRQHLVTGTIHTCLDICTCPDLSGHIRTRSQVTNNSDKHGYIQIDIQMVIKIYIQIVILFYILSDIQKDIQYIMYYIPFNIQLDILFESQNISDWRTNWISVLITDLICSPCIRGVPVFPC